MRVLRDAAGLSVMEAATRAGVNWRHWQKIESAEHSVTMRTLAHLSNGLGVDPSVLVGPMMERPPGDEGGGLVAQAGGREEAQP